MANTTHERGRAADPVTDAVHDSSWSANLEQPQHADDQQLVISQAIDAVEHTAGGTHVNLVTHGNHGHPADYLYTELDGAVTDRDIEVEYVEQCGCGGHVTRVSVR
ncbi:MAG: CGCGG family rSAM-modified RiPP protein [Halobacteriaceae archaeon]